MNKRKKNRIKQRFREFTQKITWSKVLILLLFANSAIIEGFACYVILKQLDLAEYTGMMPDLTPLNTLIGACIGNVIAYGIYSLKAAKENSRGGIIYDLAIEGGTGDGTEQLFDPSNTDNTGVG